MLYGHEEDRNAYLWLRVSDSRAAARFLGVRTPSLSLIFKIKNVLRKIRSNTYTFTWVTLCSLSIVATNVFMTSIDSARVYISRSRVSIAYRYRVLVWLLDNAKFTNCLSYFRVGPRELSVLRSSFAFLICIADQWYGSLWISRWIQVGDIWIYIDYTCIHMETNPYGIMLVTRRFPYGARTCGTT